jgi:hypothetical protein
MNLLDMEFGMNLKQCKMSRQNMA